MRATSLWVLFVACGVVAQNCNSTSQCPQRAPCCSEYGFCGRGGSYCLGGCDPFGSYELESCQPNPKCREFSTDFRQDLGRILMNGTEYDGDAESYDWIVNQGRLVSLEEGARLVLTEAGGGTLLSSTRYVHYGTIEFRMQSSKWVGVITAAITMSDVKDEIDFEWAGANTTHVQTNHWFLGIANYSDSQIQHEETPGDTADQFHKYTIDWQEDYMRWLIDDEEVRRVTRESTEQNGIHRFPTTPSRVQISLWPGGSNEYANGTIEWAGGEISYEHEDYIDQGYYWCTVQKVDVWCANSPTLPSNDSLDAVTGWVYTGNSSQGIPDVKTTERDTILSGGLAHIRPSKMIPLVMLAGFSSGLVTLSL